MRGRLLALAIIGAGLATLLFPEPAYAWTPGTHIYLAESVLANLHLLPMALAELLRGYPTAFLYGNIAADSSIAKRYAPLGRHCHYWHVGQEIHDLAATDTLRAFGLGYLCHLAADTVAHNYFVPRQLLLTSSTAAVGHSYWETRVEAHLGDAYARTAKEVIGWDHLAADTHLDRLIAPTIFSVRTNRRLFRGMVHLTETTSWQRASQVAREFSRWPLEDPDVERHLALSFDFMMELLGEPATTSVARHLDPSGERPLKSAKELRRRVLRDRRRRDASRLREVAQEHFGLPNRAPTYWHRLSARLPWHLPAKNPLPFRRLASSG